MPPAGSPHSPESTAAPCHHPIGVDEPKTIGHYVQPLHPVLADLLNRLDGAPAGDELTQRALTVSTSTLVGEPIDRAVALIPHRWMPDRAVGDGIAFLAAGYPKTR